MLHVEGELVRDAAVGAVISGAVKLGVRTLTPDWSFAIGVTSGLLKDYYGQIMENGRNGLHGRERFLTIDGGHIAKAAIAGGVGGLLGWGAVEVAEKLPIDQILSEVGSLVNKLGTFVHDHWASAAWAGEPASQPENPTKTAVQPGEKVEFAKPDPHGLKIPSTNVDASSVKGAAEWEWFKSHLGDVQTKDGLVMVEVNGIAQPVDISDPNKLDPEHGYHKRLYEIMRESHVLAPTHDQEVQVGMQGFMDLNKARVIMPSIGNDYLIPHYSSLTGERFTYILPDRQWLIQQSGALRSQLGITIPAALTDKWSSEELYNYIMKKSLVDGRVVYA